MLGVLSLLTPGDTRGGAIHWAPRPHLANKTSKPLPVAFVRRHCGTSLGHLWNIILLLNTENENENEKEQRSAEVGVLACRTRASFGTASSTRRRRLATR
eukprot:SAG11_NODE_12687_length_690_cov_1.905245_1_plen_99_part_01